MRGACYEVISRGSALEYPGSEPFEVIGFRGPGEPGQRVVNEKAKAKARRRRQLAKGQKRHMRRAS
jgi:hypothetical protein